MNPPPPHLHQVFNYLLYGRISTHLFRFTQWPQLPELNISKGSRAQLLHKLKLLRPDNVVMTLGQLCRACRHPERGCQVLHKWGHLTQDDLKEPDAAVAGVLLGFEAGDTAAEGLSDQQRRHLLGQCIDMNLLTWLVQTISPISAPPVCPPTQSNPANPGSPTETSPAPTSTEYLSLLQTLPPHAFLPAPDGLCPSPFPQPDSSQLHTPPAFTDGGGTRIASNS